MPSTRSPSLASEWESLKDQLLQFISIIFVACIVALFGITFVEFQKRKSLPFCNDFDDIHDESCQRCPDNGVCWGGDLQCLPGFSIHGRACVRDSKLLKAVKAIENHILHCACGQFSFPLCRWSGSQWFSVDEEVLLVDAVKVVTQFSLDPTKSKLILEEGLEAARKQLVERRTSNSVLELQCPAMLREHYRSYLCQFQSWTVANYLKLLVATPLVLLVIKILFHRYHKRKILMRAEELYLQVCKTLEERAQKKNMGKEPWIVASHLRDHLLTPRERQDNLVWLMVMKLVNKDSRIDECPKLVKGESKVVWEWQVEGTLSSPSSELAKQGQQ